MEPEPLAPLCPMCYWPLAIHDQSFEPRYWCVRCAAWWAREELDEDDDAVVARPM